jgi:5-methylcytosine-specific restriction enzyme A
MKTPCRFPGCPSLLDKSGFCEKHKSHAGQAKRDYEVKRKRDPVLSFNHQVRTSKKWGRVRLLKLSADPLCEDPHGDHARRGVTATATTVHHIKGLSSHPELAYDWDNLMSLCVRCHNKIEAEVRGNDATH